MSHTSLSRFWAVIFRGKTLIAAAVLFAVVSTGAALLFLGQPKPVAAKGTTISNPLQKQPLSNEAQCLYYYLILTDAMSNRDIKGMNEALKQLLTLDPSQSLFRDAATVFMNAKNFTELQNVAAEGLKRYPSDRLLTLMLSTSYSETGAPAKAIAALEKYLDKNTFVPTDKEMPDYETVLTELVRLYVKENDKDKAIATLPTLERVNTEQSLLLQARIEKFAGRFDKAQTVLLKASELAPTNGEVWFGLGELAERKNKTSLALQHYQKAYKFNPGDLELLLRMLALYVEENKIADAIKLVEDPKLPPHSALQAALFLSEKGFAKEAIGLVRYIEDRGYNRDETAVFLSVVHMNNNKNVDEAVKALESVADDSPVYEGALERYIRLMLWQKNYAKAQSLAEKGVRMFPASPTFIEVSAYALSGQNKFAEAAALLQNALPNFKNNEDLRFTLANIEDEAGNKQKAFAIMEKIIEDNPKHANALNYVGYTLAESNKDPKRALSLLKQAIAEEPSSWYILDSLAWAHYRLGEYADAWKNILLSIELGATEAVVWEHYGDIAKALNKPDEAQKGYNEALKREPENAKQIKEKRNALKK